MSRRQLFNKISDDKLKQLQTKQIKRRSFAKMQWAFKAYNEWRDNKLQESYDSRIFEANIDCTEGLKKENVAFSLCKFIPEITKVKDGGPYPGSTLYQFVVSIQRHLNEKGLPWKLIDSPEFKSVKTVLDNVMKERAQENVGMVKKQAGVMNYKVEDLLWKQNVLGEETPDQLRNTVLFLIGINCRLRAGDEHYDLCRDSPNKPSQLTFKRNEDGVRCLVYSEDTITKTNDGGIDSLKKDRKVRWIHPSNNVNRCTVHLVDKYMSLCPPVTKRSMKPNFYLRSLERTNPAQWYSTQVVGLNTLKKTVGEMLKNTKLDGFFSNHSLRRTGISHLFQAGVPQKLIKEYSGHRSEALDRY